MSDNSEKVFEEPEPSKLKTIDEELETEETTEVAKEEEPKKRIYHQG